MFNVSTSAAVAAVVAAAIVFFVRFNNNRQHVRKLQAANAVGPDRASVESLPEDYHG